MSAADLVCESLSNPQAAPSLCDSLLVSHGPYSRSMCSVLPTHFLQSLVAKNSGGPSTMYMCISSNAAYVSCANVQRFLDRRSGRRRRCSFLDRVPCHSRWAGFQRSGSFASSESCSEYSCPSPSFAHAPHTFSQPTADFLQTDQRLHNVRAITLCNNLIGTSGEEHASQQQVGCTDRSNVL